MNTSSKGDMTKPPDLSEYHSSITDELKSKEIFSGLRWTGAGQVTTEGVRMLVSIVLANLLSPGDFGLLSMASVATSFIMIFQYLGTSAVIIRQKMLSRALVNSLFILNVLFSLVLSLGLIFAAPLLASIYGEPTLIPIIQVMGLSFVITVAGTIPGSLLNRDMRFDLVAQAAFIGALVQGVIAIVMAYMGYEVWALVISNVISTAATSVFMWKVSGWQPNFTFTWSEVKQVAAFCLNMTGFHLIEYFSRDSDKFIIGKWLGEASLGYYTMAYRFCLYPPMSISPIINRVLFPTFSRVQDDNQQAQNIFLRAVGGIAFITLPMIVGLMVIATPFVHVVLGEKWLPAVSIIIWLSPVGIFNAIVTPATYVILSKGRTSWLFKFSIVSGIATITALAIGLQWGIIGISIAYSLVTIPLTGARFVMAFRLIELKTLGLIKALAPYSVCTFAMAVAIYGARLALRLVEVAPLIEILVVVPFGILVYTGLILVWRPPALKDFLSVLPTKARAYGYKILKALRVQV
ncbi:MAG: MOP flippase family protein [candidate division Zixibacteria bacterium]|nr:MOP flippase family protein [candidate division Zixibacteria bacterium]